ncbi:MAG: sugar ABC transporter ATP-binding protein [Deltaproteobacteria bacterium]|nr:sugar ABC transporter ATP-binding protein [Deltaproteobacteria bacterium]
MTLLLEMRGISKSYPGVQALDRVDLDLAAGEVHVIAGENGAGKSTLMRVLAGAVSPDAGEILLEGHPRRFRGPRDALAAGIAVVYQEGSLAPHLTVAENVFLGREPGRVLLDRKAMRERTGELLARIGGASISPDAVVDELGVASRQLVEVARALGEEGRILVLDEPTASLTLAEVPALFEAIGSLRARGMGIFYISHRLEEFARIGDRVTVLRGGRRVWSGAVQQASIQLLVEQMAGRSPGELFPERAPPGEGGAPLLEVRGLCAGPLVDVDLRVGRGEIVGVAGLVGSGRSSLCRALFGALPARSGTIALDGAPLVLRGPADAVRAGIGLVPEDRQVEALALHLGVAQNVTLASLDLFRRGIALDLGRERARAAAIAGSLAIKHRDLEQRVAELSGGNQQKVVVARWLCREARLLVCDEPARGIDVGARADLFALFARLAAEGRGLLVVSSALPELLGLCHRIVVLHRGRAVADLDAAGADERTLMNLMSLGGAEIS